MVGRIIDEARKGASAELLPVLSVYASVFVFFAVGNPRGVVGRAQVTRDDDQLAVARSIFIASKLHTGISQSYMPLSCQIGPRHGRLPRAFRVPLARPCTAKLRLVKLIPLFRIP
jgi:hypothetical protein